MIYLSEVRKSPEGLAFNEAPSLLESIKERYDQVLNLEQIQASGHVAMTMVCTFWIINLAMILPCHLAVHLNLWPLVLTIRFQKPLYKRQTAALQKELVEENLVLILDGDTINLDESILDNILLNIPLRVLTPEEESGQISLSGNDWEVLSEEDFAALQQEKKEASNPFAQLNGLFDEN